LFCVGLRAWQMHGFISRELENLPHYGGTERRVVFLDYRPHLAITDLFTSYYAGDLVQNDPWLRKNEIRMYSHGDADDEKLMSQYYPAFHLVYRDLYGSVWSKAATALTP